MLVPSLSDPSTGYVVIEQMEVCAERVVAAGLNHPGWVVQIAICSRFCLQYCALIATWSP